MGLRGSPRRTVQPRSKAGRDQGGVRRGRSCRRQAWLEGGPWAQSGQLVMPVGQRSIWSRGGGQQGIPLSKPHTHTGPQTALRGVGGGGAPRASGHSQLGCTSLRARPGAFWVCGLGHRRPVGVCGCMWACADVCGNVRECVGMCGCGAGMGYLPGIPSPLPSPQHLGMSLLSSPLGSSGWLPTLSVPPDLGVRLGTRD